MTRTTKKAPDAVDADALLGEVALVRSSIWQNGQKKVAAMVTEVTTDPAFLPDGAIALVALTAFPPGAPSRMLVDVPLYPRAVDSSLLPAAWIKKA